MNLRGTMWRTSLWVGLFATAPLAPVAGDASGLIEAYEDAEYRDLLADANEALDADPNDASLHYLRGAAWWRLGNSYQALSDFRRGALLESQARVRSDAATTDDGGSGEDDALSTTLDRLQGGERRAIETMRRSAGRSRGTRIASPILPQRATSNSDPRLPALADLPDDPTDPFREDADLFGTVVKTLVEDVAPDEGLDDDMTGDDVASDGLFEEGPVGSGVADTTSQLDDLDDVDQPAEDSMDDPYDDDEGDLGDPFLDDDPADGGQDADDSEDDSMDDIFDFG